MVRHFVRDKETLLEDVFRSELVRRVRVFSHLKKGHSKKHSILLS